MWGTKQTCQRGTLVENRKGQHYVIPLRIYVGFTIGRWFCLHINDDLHVGRQLPSIRTDFVIDCFFTNSAKIRRF